MYTSINIPIHIEGALKVSNKISAHLALSATDDLKDSASMIDIVSVSFTPNYIYIYM
jgi:hypothetical protein